MPMLTPDECRVLGVLIEKAQTTPAQYPLTLNALTAGCNQKNNREPVAELSEERVYDAVESLRRKGLVREAMLSGSRVSKFKHEVREKLALGLDEMVLLAELWLRGPQSAGELRARAARMHALGPIEEVQATLRGLMQPREAAGGPIVRELPPAPGERTHRYAQMLCPQLHPTDPAPRPAGSTSESGPAPHGPARSESTPGGLEARLERLEAEVAALKLQVERLTPHAP